jgi:exodeoxyribonuclease V alpha subunit
VSVDIALAAPTGRAAKRLEELAGSTAATIHRLLGARRGSGSVTAGFEHDAGNPIDARLVVVDEASMLDVELAAALLSALKDGTHLIIVGDPAQLPSIGPGRVLGDMIDSGVIPVTELKTLYRQTEGGAIARLAMAVRGGDLAPVADEHREVVIVPARGSEEGARRVVQLVTDSIPRVFGTTADQLQVVTPVHRGPAGTQALNRALKAVLNPGRGVVRGFDTGDRVVATANHLDAEPTGYANGEVGTVVSTGDNSLRVAFTTGESEISGKSLNDLLHGWAITVHRAQGSEWEAVVAVMPPEAGSMLSRPLVYTALTRARKHLSVIHAAGPMLARAVRQVGAEPRRTRLASLLQAGAAAVPGAEAPESSKPSSD